MLRVTYFAAALAFATLTLSAPVLATNQALVFDIATGQVTHAENIDRKWHPASLTKLMTAYVTFAAVRDKRISRHTILRASMLGNSQEPTRLWLPLDTQLPLGALLDAMIVKSANDAAAMVADAVGGSFATFTRYGACRPNAFITSPKIAISYTPSPQELFKRKTSGLGAVRYDDAVPLWRTCRYDTFIRMMNATAARLGMTETVFTNPNGLPDHRQVTTARDLSTLAIALLRDFPNEQAIFARKDMRLRGGRLRSYNAILRTFEGGDGMKTGFICASGYNIVASATRNNRRIIAIVLGGHTAKARNGKTSALMETAFGITPENVAHHARFLSSLGVSGNPDRVAPDTRASLKSRSCRRSLPRRTAKRRKSQKKIVRAASPRPKRLRKRRRASIRAKKPRRSTSRKVRNKRRTLKRQN